MFRHAKELWLREMDEKGYSYLIAYSPQGDTPIVRQNTDGTYFVAANGLRCLKVNEDKILPILASTKIETGGLLDGVGGVCKHNMESSACYTINAGWGFIRYRGNAASVICFYGGYPHEKKVRLEGDDLTLFAIGSNGTEIEYSDTYSSINVNAIAERTEVYQWMQEHLFRSEPEILNRLLFIPIFFVIAKPVTAIPFVIWMRKKLRLFHEITIEEMLFCGTAICGLIAFFLLGIQGASQVYFFITACIFSDLIGIQYLADNYQKMHIWKKGIVWAMVFVGLCTGLSYGAYQTKMGVTKAVQSYRRENAGLMPAYDYVTEDEINAMNWLRENSPEDAVVAYNRQVKSPDYIDGTEQPLPNQYTARFYSYTAYSERQAFLGGWSYMARTPEMQKMLRERYLVNRALFSPFCSNRRELMEANGISYLVASEYIGSGTELDDHDLMTVYRNRDMVIYKLKETKKQN